MRSPGTTIARRVLHALIALLLLAGPVWAAPEPPPPPLRESLPRIVSGFLAQVHNDVARLLGVPLVPRGPDFVTRDVLLGPELGSAKDYDRLVKLGVGSVLDLRGEKSDDAAALAARDLHGKRIAVEDYHAPTPEQLREAVAWMRGEIAAGRRVYVHCAAGIGRSATVVAAFLMEEYGWSRDRAWGYVESRRPIVKQTDEQRDALRALEGPSAVGATRALDRGFERASDRPVVDLALDRARDAERDAER